jgi:hypothetical protein
MTAFIITKDFIAEKEDRVKYPDGRSNLHAVNLIGPRNASSRDEARLKAGEGIEFRLLDDDRNVYYKGRRLETSDADREYGGESELAPLDCFGAPNAGCTIQEELNKEGKWEAIN